MTTAESPTFFRFQETLKRFCLLFLPLVAFISCLAILLYVEDIQDEKDALQINEARILKLQSEVVQHNLDSVIRDINLLSKQRELLLYIESTHADHRNLLANEWLFFARIKGNYSQIRYINSEGQEQIRISKVGETPSLVLDNIDNKAQPFVSFQEAMALTDGGIVLSSYALSSHKSGKSGQASPVIRFATPVVDQQGEPQGIVVLDYLAEPLVNTLEKTVSDTLGTRMLVNHQGYYLHHPQEEKTWGFLLAGREHQTFRNDFPEPWQTLHNDLSGQTIFDGAIITYDTIFPLRLQQGGSKADTGTQSNHQWKTISVIPPEIFAVRASEIRERFILPFIICSLMMAIGCWLLARTTINRMLAEEARRESEARLRAINATAADAIISMNHQGRITYFNPAAEKMFGYSSDELRNKDLHTLLTPSKYRSSFKKEFEKFKLTGQGKALGKHLELSGLRKDQTEFPVEIAFSGFELKNEHHSVGVIRDITLRKKNEKEVSKAQKLESLGILAGGIAHDFNNLLTAIIGNISLSTDPSEQNEKNMELLGNAHQAAIRAKALSQQLLIFSKGGEPIRKTTSLVDIIQDSVNFALHGSAIDCRLSIADDLWLADIDSTQMHQVFQNILINAKQAISGPGYIDISCSNVTDFTADFLPKKLTGKYIQFVIKDNGPGISPKDFNKIFDPYYTTKKEGSGLGLAIAYSIIRKHDSHIAIQSTPGKGTTFYIYLPASLEQSVPEQEATEEEKSRHLRIMVMDDEAMLLNITQKMLASLGHETIPVKNGIEAIVKYKELWKTGSPVDAIIMDLTIPGSMGGIETVGAILDINTEAIIIVSSGYSNDPVMVNFEEYGFCGAIAKPFDVVGLQKIIERTVPL